MFNPEGLEPRGNRRVIYVSDPSSVANRYLPDPVREEDLKRWIDAIAAAEIDTFVQEVYTQGWSVYWRGDVFEYDARPQHRRFLPLRDGGLSPAGLDPALFIERLPVEHPPREDLDGGARRGSPLGCWAPHEARARE